MVEPLDLPTVFGKDQGLHESPIYDVAVMPSGEVKAWAVSSSKRGYGINEILGRKRAIKPNLDDPDRLTLTTQIVHRLLNGFRTGSHQNNHALCLLISEIFKQAIVPPG